MNNEFYPTGAEHGEYWQPELETMPREELEKLQVAKLKKSVEIALKSPFYKKRLGELGLTPDDFNSVSDIRKLPFTTKADLRENYPFGLVGGNLDDAIEEAAKLAELEDYSVDEYPAEPSWMDKLMKKGGDSYFDNRLRATLGEAYPMAMMLRQLLAAQRLEQCIYARLPFGFDIR